MVVKWLAMILIMTAVSGSFGQYVQLEYSCNPSGAITVKNPDNTLYLSAHAALSDGSQVCAVLATFMRMTFVIHGCPISRNISFYLTKTATPPDILTGDLGFYHIRCQQIPATGVYRKVTDESWVTNYISSSMAPCVTPTIILDTHIEDITSGVKRTSAIVGEPLRWEINVPDEYIALPLNCSAISGAGNDSIDIILNGCSLDTYLVHHFDYDSPTNKQQLATRLYAFRFANSDEIIILCRILGCKEGASTACDLTCPGGPDKRSLDEKRNGSPEQRSHDGNMAEDDHFVFHTQVSVGLSVVEDGILEKLHSGGGTLKMSSAASLSAFAVVVSIWRT